MNYPEFLHYKPKIIKLIFESYLEGYSTEQISWRLSILKVSCSWEDINAIIDFVLECNY